VHPDGACGGEGRGGRRRRRKARRTSEGEKERKSSRGRDKRGREGKRMSCGRRARKSPPHAKGRKAETTTTTLYIKINDKQRERNET
jgi:hypothetical protein